MNQGQLARLSGQSPEPASPELQVRAGFPSSVMHIYAYLEIQANLLLKYAEFMSVKSQDLF